MRRSNLIRRAVATETIAGRNRMASSVSNLVPIWIGSTHGPPQQSFVASFAALRSFATTSERVAQSLQQQQQQQQQRLLCRNHNRSHPQTRWLSTEIRAQTAAAAAANASMAASQEAAKKTTKHEPNNNNNSNRNVFLDNLGKIFLTAIATVILTLVRSSYNTSNRHLVRDRLEEIAALDPKEIEEFREANADLTLETFRRILSIYYREFARSDTSGGVSGDDDSSGPTSSYGEFVFTIRKIMATRFPKQGESFTIEMGHYLDRVVVDVLQHKEPGASMGESDELPVALFFTAMAAAMNGSVSDRIRILHEILVTEEVYFQRAGGTGGDDDGIDAATKPVVPLGSVRTLVGHLQNSCQLPPETQIVPTDRKYPTQLWRRATPGDMVPDIHIDNDNGTEPEPNGNNSSSSSSSNNNNGGVDLVEFAAILRTKSVCAWGECYMKFKPDTSEFESTGPPPTALPPGLGGAAVAN